MDMIFPGGGFPGTCQTTAVGASEGTVFLCRSIAEGREWKLAPSCGLPSVPWGALAEHRMDLGRSVGPRRGGRPAPFSFFCHCPHTPPDFSFPPEWVSAHAEIPLPRTETEHQEADISHNLQLAKPLHLKAVKGEHDQQQLQHLFQHRYRDATRATLNVNLFSLYSIF